MFDFDVFLQYTLTMPPHSLNVQLLVIIIKSTRLLSTTDPFRQISINALIWLLLMCRYLRLQYTATTATVAIIIIVSKGSKSIGEPTIGDWYIPLMCTIDDSTDIQYFLLRVMKQLKLLLCPCSLSAVSTFCPSKMECSSVNVCTDSTGSCVIYKSETNNMKRV